MSLLPAYFGRKRNSDLAPEREPDSETREDVFSLIPPRVDDLDDKLDNLSKPEPPLKAERSAKPAKAEKKSGAQPVGISELARLSFDNEGRLFWDGKPVETHHRFAMSRRQTIGATLVAAFIVLGALGAMLQGTTAAYGWACKLGWATTFCEPTAPEPVAAPDIPA